MQRDGEMNGTKMHDGKPTKDQYKVKLETKQNDSHQLKKPSLDNRENT